MRWSVWPKYPPPGQPKPSRASKGKALSFVFRGVVRQRKFVDSCERLVRENKHAVALLPKKSHPRQGQSLVGRLEIHVRVPPHFSGHGIESAFQRCCRPFKCRSIFVIALQLGPAQEKDVVRTESPLFAG